MCYRVMTREKATSHPRWNPAFLGAMLHGGDFQGNFATLSKALDYLLYRTERDAYLEFKIEEIA